MDIRRRLSGPCSAGTQPRATIFSRRQATSTTRTTRRFIGVYWCANRWMALVRYRGKTYYCGRFDDEIEAAKARDRKAYELCGEFAYLNFPEDLPKLRRLYPQKRPRNHKATKKSRS